MSVQQNDDKIDPFFWENIYEMKKENSENFVNFVTEKNMPGSENASKSNEWMQIELRAEFYYLIWARLFNCAKAIISLVTDLMVGQV